MFRGRREGKSREEKGKRANEGRRNEKKDEGTTGKTEGEVATGRERKTDERG